MKENKEKEHIESDMKIYKFKQKTFPTGEDDDILYSIT